MSRGQMSCKLFAFAVQSENTSTGNPY